MRAEPHLLRAAKGICSAQSACSICLYLKLYLLSNEIHYVGISVPRGLLVPENKCFWLFCVRFFNEGLEKLEGRGEKMLIKLCHGKKT